MLRLLVLALAVTATLAGPIKIDLNRNGTNLTSAVPFRDIGGRIISGSPASLGQFPWQAALYISVPEGTAFCGGSLISPGWILTAGHCIDGTVTAITAYLGVVALNNEDGRVTVAIKTAYLHENYDGQKVANDIALLEINTAVQYTANVRNIALASSTLADGTAVTVSGFGRTSDSNPSISQTLNYAGLTTISNSQCTNSYGSIIQNGIVCTLGESIESTCNGDSGGPLVTGSGDNAVHVGIVSFGSNQGCARGYPAAFTRTAYYRSWITGISGL